MGIRFAACFTALSLAATVAHASTGVYTQTYPISGRASVHVKVDDASVRVIPSDARQVDLRVEYQGYVPDKSLRLGSQATGDRVELHAQVIGRIGISFDIKPRHVRVEVRMPRNADLEIESGDGNVDVSAIEGTVTVRTGDGRLKATGLSGVISLRTGDGGIEVEALKGEVRLHTGDGAIEGAGLDGQYKVSTGDGRVRLAGRFDALDITSGDGGIDARAAAGSRTASDWNIRSGDGSIAVTLPADFQARLDASTGDGRISLGLPVAVEGSLDKSHVRGTLNGGGGKLAIRTGDGAIRLDRS